MKLIVRTFYNLTPLEILKKQVPFEQRDSKVVKTNNKRVGAAIFRWLYSKAPSSIWDGFMQQANLTPDVFKQPYNEE